MAILKTTGFFVGITVFVALLGSWVNSPPKIEIGDRFTVVADSTLNVTFNIWDADGDSINIFVDNKPPWLNLDAQNLLLKGTPKLWDKGQHLIRLKATDGKVIQEKLVEIIVKVPLSPEDLITAKLKAYFRDSTAGLSGVSAAIVTPGGQLYTALEGKANSNSTKPLDVNTQYRIASITKTFTAVLCLRLMEEGLIQLDDPIAKYIDVSGVPYGQKITIRQLLNHTSGLIDHLNRNDFYTGNWKVRTWDHGDLVRYTANRRSRFVPGSNYAYSNTGFYFLGTLIEKVTEQELGVAFDQWIIQPMGLSNTFYDTKSNTRNKIPALAENSRTYEYHMSAVGAAGAMISTPSDVAKFGAAVYNGDFLQPYTKTLMTTDVTSHFDEDAYGLGTRMWEDYDIYHIGHTGTLMGYRSVLMYIPEKQVIIALSTNQRHRRWYRLVNGLLRDVYWYF